MSIFVSSYLLCVSVPLPHCPPCHNNCATYMDQSAFAYTAVAPDKASAHPVDPTDNNDGSNDHFPPRMVTVRRLRVSTSRTEASSRVGEVSEMADPATVAGVLAHKVVSEARRRCQRFSKCRNIRVIITFSLCIDCFVIETSISGAISIVTVALIIA